MYVVEGKISIHALVKRATLKEFVQSLDVEYFNPRPRKEGDWWWHYTTTINYNFNPRPRKEGDANCLVSLINLIKFQSTPS